MSRTSPSTSEARYRKLYPRIWTHPVFTQLSAQDRLVALYLLTGPQSNRIGYYRLSTATASEDLGMTKPALERALVRVTAAFFWRWDATFRVIWLTSWWKWNPPGSANNLKGAMKDYGEVPDSELSDEFWNHTSEILEQFDVSSPNPSRRGTPTPTPTPPEGVPLPLAKPYPHPSRTQEQDQEQEQDQKQDQEQVRSGPEPNIKTDHPVTVPFTLLVSIAKAVVTEAGPDADAETVERALAARCRAGNVALPPGQASKVLAEARKGEYRAARGGGFTAVASMSLS